MLIGLIIAAFCISVDQIVKVVIEANLLKGEEFDLIPNFLYITKVYNTGGAWSIFSDSTIVLALISLVAAAIFIYILRKFKYKEYKLMTVALGLVIGGTIGNMIDRFMCVFKIRPGVVDFIGTQFGSYYFPVFNIADICLCIGLALVCIDLLFLDGKRENPLFKETTKVASSDNLEIDNEDLVVSGEEQEVDKEVEEKNDEK